MIADFDSIPPIPAVFGEARQIAYVVDDIDQAMDGNLCRCGTYPAHIKAILEASAVLRGG